MSAAAPSFAEALPPPLRAARPVQVLEDSWQRGRLAHAILLHGPSLPALSTVALALAGVILQAPGRAAAHPDLFTLRPARKARQIRIGERDGAEPNTLRKLLRDIQQSPNQGSRKVAIVYEADRMNAATSNAFLKTLEEPPADTTILLLTARPYELLPTIRSRCFNFRLPVALDELPDPEWETWRQRYRDWLKLLSALPAQPAARAEAVMGLYGLVSRFNSVVGSLGDRLWSSEKENLPEHLDEEERDALEAGVRKTFRQRLFADIEHETRQHAASLLSGAPGARPPLAEAIAVLEQQAGLLEVNLREDTALEHFLLRSLRLWTRPAPAAR